MANGWMVVWKLLGRLIFVIDLMGSTVWLENVDSVMKLRISYSAYLGISVCRHVDLMDNLKLETGYNCGVTSSCMMFISS